MDFTMGHVAGELGATFPPVEGTFFSANSAVATGQVLEVDYALTSGDNLRVGENDSGLSRAIQASTQGRSGGRCLVITKHTARQLRPVRCVLVGFVDILIIGTTLAGDGIVISGGADNNGKRIWGRVLESGGSASVATRIRCLWDGIHGFGQIGTITSAPPDNPVYPADDIIVVQPGPPGPGDDPGITVPNIPGAGGGTPVRIGAIS